MSDHGRDYNISVLDSALQVLETFLGQGRGEQNLTEISQRLGLNKSRTFRILATLERHGFVEHDPATKTYRLGLRLLELGSAVQRRLSIIPAARPVMDELALATGEAVFLGIVDGDQCLVIDKRESQHPIRLYGEVGRRSPLHVGGVPKTLLAYLVEEQPDLLERLPLPQITPATVTDRDRLRAILAQIRADGYVVTLDDLDQGAHSVAAPIRDHSSRVVAGLSVAGPSDRFTADRVERYTLLVRRAAADISQRLGFPPLLEALTPVNGRAIVP